MYRLNVDLADSISTFFYFWLLFQHCFKVKGSYLSISLPTGNNYDNDQRIARHEEKTSQFVHQNELDFTRFKIEQSFVHLLSALNSYVLFFIPNTFGILKRPCKDIRVPVYLPFHPNKPTHTNNTKTGALGTSFVWCQRKHLAKIFQVTLSFSRSVRND